MTAVAVVRYGAEVRTHARVRERASRLASALRGLGLRHGDRYALVMRNEIGFVEAPVPQVVVFDDALPRENTGTLFKRTLKARYGEGHDS